MKLIAVFLITLLGTTAFGQSTSTQDLNLGLEQDLLPYVTGGYYAGVWAGRSHVRMRALTARVNKPDLIVPEGFENNWVTAYAVLGEYFLKEKWTDWSASAGFVYWQNSIELKGGSPAEDYDTYLINGSISYTFTLYRHLYVTPWAGLHLKVGGPETITIGTESFNQPLLNPEASLKIGVYF